LRYRLFPGRHPRYSIVCYGLHRRFALALALPSSRGPRRGWRFRRPRVLRLSSIVLPRGLMEWGNDWACGVDSPAPQAFFQVGAAALARHRGRRRDVCPAPGLGSCRRLIKAALRPLGGRAARRDLVRGGRLRQPGRAANRRDGCRRIGRACRPETPARRTFLPHAGDPARCAFVIAASYRAIFAPAWLTIALPALDTEVLWP